ncbi:MAG: MarR family transcriptional regulator, partial [Nanoarchaeota archaeon]|nr:MarR family transcriptional regulator [Nanoarchaeota archaeon]MBU4352420.1 MarR family transcriptional regulator [Nanoarchaeota archaeon]MBU4456053.1 MarR family transcriptional regulator [Nanoarchaeota archaeon]MCG2720286.1 MarR family transcriptional regulator [Nanoarchaeota archaeon]
MIDFACKRFSLDEIIKCSLRLSKADCKVMHFLLKELDWITTKDLTKKLKLNITTVQRAVKKLHEKKVLTRSQENLKDGGYIFYYKIKNKKELRELIIQLVNNWVKNVENELNRW